MFLSRCVLFRHTPSMLEFHVGVHPTTLPPSHHTRSMSEFIPQLCMICTGLPWLCQLPLLLSHHVHTQVLNWAGKLGTPHPPSIHTTSTQGMWQPIACVLVVHALLNRTRLFFCRPSIPRASSTTEEMSTSGRAADEVYMKVRHLL